MGSGRSQPDPIFQDRTALVALIEAGLTIDEIADRAGRSRSTVRRRARRLGLPPFKPGRRPTPTLVDRDALAALIASGLSTAQIAERLGRSPLLRDAGWLEEQFAAGKSPRVIATEVGCSKAAVRLAARDAGVTPRARRSPPHTPISEPSIPA